jgi:hypothetical protein
MLLHNIEILRHNKFENTSSKGFCSACECFEIFICVFLLVTMLCWVPPAVFERGRGEKTSFEYEWSAQLEREAVDGKREDENSWGFVGELQRIIY